MGIDMEIAKVFQRTLAKQGIHFMRHKVHCVGFFNLINCISGMKFMMNTKVIGGKKEGTLVKINVENAKGGNPKTV